MLLFHNVAETPKVHMFCIQGNRFQILALHVKYAMNCHIEKSENIPSIDTIRYLAPFQRSTYFTAVNIPRSLHSFDRFSPWKVSWRLLQQKQSYPNYYDNPGSTSTAWCPCTCAIGHYLQTAVHCGYPQTTNMAMHVPRAPGFAQMLKSGAKVSYFSISVLMFIITNNGTIIISYFRILICVYKLMGQVWWSASRWFSALVVVMP
jgi:hypothetical protein